MNNLIYKTKIEKMKFFMKLNMYETVKLLENIDYNNAEIKSEKIITKISEYPFCEENNQIQFLLPIKKTFATGVVNTNIIDGISPIISLLSLEDKLNNKINSLISLQILPNLDIGSIYINYNLLKKINFNEYSKLKLIKTENITDINKTLIIFKEGLTGNAIFRNKFDLNDFEEMSIQNKIEKIRNVLETIYARKYKIFTNYIIFKSGDLNLNIYTKKDYLNLLNSIENNNNINTFNFLRFYDDNTYRTFFKNKLFSLNNKSLNEEFTISQKLSTKNASLEQFSIINGIPGSGKTHISIQLIISNLYLSAVAKANFNKNINFLFTTYNKKALSDFKERFINYKIQNLLFINEELDSNFNNVLDHLIYKIENLNEFNEINRFKEIEERLKKEFTNTQKMLEIYFEIKDIKEKFSSLTNVNTKLKYVERLEKILSKNININGLERFLHNLGFKVKKQPINIDISTVKNLKGVIKLGNNDKNFNINQFVGENLLNKISSLKSSAKQSDKKNEDEIKNNLLKLEKKFEELNSIEKEENNIPFEDIIFYLEKFYLKNKEYNLQLLKYLKLSSNYKNNKLELENLKKILEKDNKDINNEIFNIFPVHLSIVSKLGKVYKLKEYFDLTIVDEAFQTPGYFFTSILSRTNNIIGVGDNGQLENNNLYNKLTEQNLYNNIYDIEKSSILKTSLKEIELETNNEELYEFYSKYGTSKTDNNVFNLLKKINDNTNNVLIDNFRSNKNIVNATLFTSFKYRSIIKSFIEKNINYLKDGKYKEDLQKELDNWDKNSIFKIVNTFVKRKEIYYTLTNNEVKGSLFYCNTGFINNINDGSLENNIFKILKFIENQKEQFSGRISGNDILFITPFKQDANKTNDFLVNNKNKFPDLINGIMCESVENIQGIERKIVIFDSGIYNEQSEQINFITERPEILTVAISRSKNLFIFLGNISFINENSNQNILNQLLNENDLFKFNNIE